MSYAVRDSLTMLRRQLRHMARYPSLTLMLIGQPLVFLLLFVYVFGGTMGAGLPGVSAGDRGDYLDFITPGIVLMAVVSVSLGTAIAVATDMTGGIIDRFRTMAIARVSVLTGHVLGALIQTAVAVVVVVAVALALGFGPGASPGDWLATAGLLALLSLALTWLTIAIGLVSPNVETASNLPMPLMLLPLVGSGFVPTETMPDGLRWFAENQPFTPVIDALRGLLDGSPDGGTVLLAVAWCVAIGLAGYLWSRRLYRRRAAG
ncbi:putative ABC drug resistance transporter permease component [Patulibacter medicamentivorans]|uniref:Transport permease protein n=1 Tax=Patulibacter medicamentivorans TaxID=1097667 RepID=H0E1R9_9ACTN|nr:ABC transporter permease [Patulibacter medicamentivorans]EHN12370.1 putative ABC drug resistance transporter permease component [Patulibacter medicamentivorans]